MSRGRSRYSAAHSAAPGLSCLPRWRLPPSASAAPCGAGPGCQPPMAARQQRAARRSEISVARTGESSTTPCLPGESEPMTSVAERVTLVVGGDLSGRYREHQDRIRADLVLPGTGIQAVIAGAGIRVEEIAVAHVELPSPVPLRGPCRGEAPEGGIVGDPDGVALDHHVKPAIPAVAAGRQDHMRAGAQVDGLLLGGASAEVDGSLG